MGMVSDRKNKMSDTSSWNEFPVEGSCGSGLWWGCLLRPRGLCISSGLGTPQDPPQEELDRTDGHLEHPTEPAATLTWSWISLRQRMDGWRLELFMALLIEVEMREGPAFILISSQSNFVAATCMITKICPQTDTNTWKHSQTRSCVRSCYKRFLHGRIFRSWHTQAVKEKKWEQYSWVTF